MNTDALWIAAIPLCWAVGAVVAFMIATESGDGMESPTVYRGDSEDEPWGVPTPTRTHALPGRAGVVLPRDHGLGVVTVEYDVISGK